MTYTKTTQITVPDTYGRPWDGIAPTIGWEGHLLTEGDLDALEPLRIRQAGGTYVYPDSVRRVAESALFDEEGSYSHFEVEVPA